MTASSLRATVSATHTRVPLKLMQRRHRQRHGKRRARGLSSQQRGTAVRSAPASRPSPCTAPTSHVRCACTRLIHAGSASHRPSYSMHIPRTATVHTPYTRSLYAALVRPPLHTTMCHLGAQVHTLIEFCLLVVFSCVRACNFLRVVCGRISSG